MGDEDTRRTHYHDMLRAGIREHVSFSMCPTLGSMIARVKEREINLEHILKRKVEEGHATGALGKKPNRSDTRSKGQQSRGRCGKCGKTHEGVCRLESSGGYKCGKTGHFQQGLYCLCTHYSDIRVVVFPLQPARP